MNRQGVDPPSRVRLRQAAAGASRRSYGTPDGHDHGQRDTPDATTRRDPPSERGSKSIYAATRDRPTCDSRKGPRSRQHEIVGPARRRPRPVVLVRHVLDIRRTVNRLSPTAWSSVPPRSRTGPRRNALGVGPSTMRARIDDAAVESQAAAGVNVHSTPR